MWPNCFWSRLQLSNPARCKTDPQLSHLIGVRIAKGAVTGINLRWGGGRMLLLLSRGPARSHAIWRGISAPPGDCGRTSSQRGPSAAGKQLMAVMLCSQNKVWAIKIPMYCFHLNLLHLQSFLLLCKLCNHSELALELRPQSRKKLWCLSVSNFERWRGKKLASLRCVVCYWRQTTHQTLGLWTMWAFVFRGNVLFYKGRQCN